MKHIISIILILSSLVATPSFAMQMAAQASASESGTLNQAIDEVIRNNSLALTSDFKDILVCLDALNDLSNLFHLLKGETGTIFHDPLYKQRLFLHYVIDTVSQNKSSYSAETLKSRLYQRAYDKSRPEATKRLKYLVQELDKMLVIPADAPALAPDDHLVDFLTERLEFDSDVDYARTTLHETSLFLLNVRKNNMVEPWRSLIQNKIRLLLRHQDNGELVKTRRDLQQILLRKIARSLIKKRTAQPEKPAELLRQEAVVMGLLDEMTGSEVERAFYIIMHCKKQHPQHPLVSLELLLKLSLSAPITVGPEKGQNLNALKMQLIQEVTCERQPLAPAVEDYVRAALKNWQAALNCKETHEKFVHCPRKKEVFRNIVDLYMEEFFTAPLKTDQIDQEEGELPQAKRQKGAESEMHGTADNTQMPVTNNAPAQDFDIEQKSNDFFGIGDAMVLAVEIGRIPSVQLLHDVLKYNAKKLYEERGQHKLAVCAVQALQQTKTQEDEALQKLNARKNVLQSRIAELMTIMAPWKQQEEAVKQAEKERLESERLAAECLAKEQAEVERVKQTSQLQTSLEGVRQELEGVEKRNAEQVNKIKELEAKIVAETQERVKLTNENNSQSDALLVAQVSIAAKKNEAQKLSAELSKLKSEYESAEQTYAQRTKEHEDQIFLIKTTKERSVKAKNEQLRTLNQRLNGIDEDYEAQIEGIDNGYQGVIKELKEQVAKLEQENQQNGQELRERIARLEEENQQKAEMIKAFDALVKQQHDVEQNQEQEDETQDVNGVSLVKNKNPLADLI